MSSARRASVALDVSAVSEAMLRAGLAFLPGGERRRRLVAAFDATVSEGCSGRVAVFDRESSRAYAGIAANRRGARRPISTADCQIAAIALNRVFTLATRNMRDFELRGPPLEDPWLGHTSGRRF